MTDDLDANYRRAYGNRIGFGQRPALILKHFGQAYFAVGGDHSAGVAGALASALRGG